LGVALEIVTGNFQADALVLADHAGIAGEGDRRTDRQRPRACGPVIPPGAAAGHQR